jgi:hypothetical protein
MAVKSKAEILELIKARVGDDTSDEALAIIEDVNDTLDDYEARIADSGDWKARYEQNDAEWRQKYKDRFFQPAAENEDREEIDETGEGAVEEKTTFEDLFKEE